LVITARSGGPTYGREASSRESCTRRGATSRSSPGRWRSKAMAPIRTGVERLFGTMKRAYGYRHVRYLGLARNDVQLQTMCAAPSTCAGRWPSGCLVAPGGREGGQNEALRLADAPITGLGVARSSPELKRLVHVIRNNRSAEQQTANARRVVMVMLNQASYNQRLFGSRLRATLHVARFRWLHNFLLRERINPDAVFELGCYDAKTLEYLPRLPKEYVGCDANWEHGLDLARTKWAKHNFEFYECNKAEDIQFIENRKFDLVICMETFEHVPPIQLSRYIDLMVKTASGPVIITVPNEIGLVFFIKYVLKRGIRRLKGKETESYSIADIMWSTLGVCRRVQRGEHKGFDYRELINQLNEYFVVEEISALPFTWLPRFLGFTICIVGRKRISHDTDRQTHRIEG
jgi:2-polyprenyl-3-methyl-5-hydroxy-6-metoxy-1,4-benzoquinol methylase